MTRSELEALLTEGPRTTPTTDKLFRTMLAEFEATGATPVELHLPLGAIEEMARELAGLSSEIRGEFDPEQHRFILQMPWGTVDLVPA